MRVLLLGLDNPSKRSLREFIHRAGSPRVRLFSAGSDQGSLPGRGIWDVIVLDHQLRDHSELARAVKENSLRGLKIVLTERESLHSAIEFWGQRVYSYFLKPVRQDLFRVVWQNAWERVQLNRKLSRLEKQRSNGVLKQQEILKDLFIAHLKMQEQDQRRIDLVTRTSHELRTPLTALQGYLEVLINGKAGELSPLQSKMLNCSLNSCRRLLRLANALMDLTALEGREAPLLLERADLRPCVEGVVSELTQAAAQKGLELRTELDAGLPAFRFDSDRMQQVLTNLLENAIKFTPRGGKILLRCAPYFWERRQVQEVLRPQQDRRSKTAPAYNSIRLAVEDTGVGIPAESLPDIFEDYARGWNVNGSSKGFGLGLAVARQIVLAHEGRIWAESQPGQGSTFTVLIPTSL